MNPRPYALLAELTHRCPLHCPYCSNPAAYPRGSELSTAEWCRVIAEAGKLGVLQIGLSGGEPLLRGDLDDIVAASRQAALYTNLLTSGVGLDDRRARRLRDAGLDSLQLSFQADRAELGDSIAGARVHAQKLSAARAAREAGLGLSLNIVLHRENIDRLAEMIALAETLGADRLELANVQYYGWALLNRAQLLPTREQVGIAAAQAHAAKIRLAGRIDLFYVLPDYYESRPKPCMQGWGRRYLTVTANGDVLPCPNASSIPGMRFDNVRQRSLKTIWIEGESFNSFRGEEWMSEPCRSCPQRQTDFGGCRCQAALLTGHPNATDPVCTLSPHRALIDAVLAQANEKAGAARAWIARSNPTLAEI